MPLFAALAEVRRQQVEIDRVDSSAEIGIAREGVFEKHVSGTDVAPRKAGESQCGSGGIGDGGMALIRVGSASGGSRGVDPRTVPGAGGIARSDLALDRRKQWRGNDHVIVGHVQRAGSADRER